MILGSLADSDNYVSLHPEFKNVFKFLRSTDLATLPNGKVFLSDTTYLSVVDMSPKMKEESKLEVHRKYIDIQVPINGNEVMGWSALRAVSLPTGSFDEGSDIQFFDDVVSNFFNVSIGEFVVFFPSDAHQPGICEAKHKKIIVKILAN